MRYNLIPYLLAGVLCLMSLPACGSNNQPVPATPAEEVIEPPTTASTEPVASGQATLQMVQSETGTAIDVRVEDISSLYAIELRLTFDPATLNIADADPNKDGVQLQPGSVPAPDFVVENLVEGNEIRYVVTQIHPREAFQGSGVVMTIQLEEAIDTLPNISVSQLLVADGEGQPVNVSVQP